MHTLVTAIRLVLPHERRRGLLILILVLGMALLDTLGVASVMPFLAVLSNPELLNNNSMLKNLHALGDAFQIKSQDQFLIFLGLLTFFLILVSAIYKTFTYYAMNRYIEMLQHSLATRLLSNYLKQPYSFFLNRHSGDLSTIVLSQVNQVVGNVFRPLYNMAIYSLVLIAITALLVAVDPWLALSAAGLISGLYVVVFIVLRQKLSNLGDALVVSDKQRHVTSAEVFGGIKDIKLLGREQAYIDQFKIPSFGFAISNATYQTLNMIPHYIIEAIIFGGILLLTIIMTGTVNGSEGEVLGRILPVLGLYAFAAYRMKPAVQSIYQGFASLRYGQSAVESLYAELYLSRVTPQSQKSDRKSLKVRSNITLENLGFTYPNSISPVLVDLNLAIPVGSVIGLVGATGAGKTTFVDVFLGLLRPTAGAIKVDGIPISDSNLSAWQRGLGYVPQHIFLADTTVAQNIAFGIPKEKIDYEQVLSCARMAQVDEFITQDLPDQYETLVGERGVRLSGGQRQRIGIARALYHNPEVLVFDEATSALDSLTEADVMDSINSLAHKKTIILIAHRINTLKNCDQILLLDCGKVKMMGTFDELTRQSEQFRIMSGTC